MKNKFLAMFLVLGLAFSGNALAYFAVDGFDADQDSITMEGTTDDAFETTISITDPTADRTITVPDAAGTVVLGSTDGRVLGGVSSTLTCSSGLVVDLATTLSTNIVTAGETNTACAISFTGGTAGETVNLSHDYSGTGVVTFADVAGFDAAWTPVSAACTGIDAGVTAANNDHFYISGFMTSATEIAITGCQYFDAA